MNDFPARDPVLHVIARTLLNTQLFTIQSSHIIFVCYDLKTKSFDRPSRSELHGQN